MGLDIYDIALNTVGWEVYDARTYRHIRGTSFGRDVLKIVEKSMSQSKRRSFDCASRDETARGSAQDDILLFRMTPCDKNRCLMLRQ
jgi:hypothetical protein